MQEVSQEKKKNTKDLPSAYLTQAHFFPKQSNQEPF